MKILRIQTPAEKPWSTSRRPYSRRVESEGLQEGACLVFVPHTTAAVTINENADPDVQSDMLMGYSKMIPKADYKHFEHNSPAHMLPSLVGSSITVIFHGDECSSDDGKPSIYANSTDPRTGRSTSGACVEISSPASKTGFLRQKNLYNAPNSNERKSHGESKRKTHSGGHLSGL